MWFINLDMGALKLNGNHTQIYYTIRVEKVLRIIKIIQIVQKLEKAVDETISGWLKIDAYGIQADICKKEGRLSLYIFVT